MTSTNGVASSMTTPTAAGAGATPSATTTTTALVLQHQHHHHRHLHPCHPPPPHPSVVCVHGLATLNKLAWEKFAVPCVIDDHPHLRHRMIQDQNLPPLPAPPTLAPLALPPPPLPRPPPPLPPAAQNEELARRRRILPGGNPRATTTENGRSENGNFMENNLKLATAKHPMSSNRPTRDTIARRKQPRIAREHRQTRFKNSAETYKRERKESSRRNRRKFVNHKDIFLKTFTR